MKQKTTNLKKMKTKRISDDKTLVFFWDFSVFMILNSQNI